MIKKIKLADWKWMAVLGLISLVPLWQWFGQRIPLTHDLILQIQRVATFSESWRQGNLVPRWGGNLNWGYGHPVLMFLYPLVGYIGSLFVFGGFGFVTATKMIFMATGVLSAVGMYLFLREIYGKYPSILGTLGYLFAPYRLVDINVRGAIGELMGLAVAPWVFLAFRKLFKKPTGRTIAGAGLSLGLMIMAHNAVGLLVIVMLGIWLGGLISQTNKRMIPSIFLGLVLGFGVAAFYWMPGIIEGKYTFQKQFTSFEIFSSRYPAISELIYSPWGYGATPEVGRPSGFSVSVGIGFLLSVMISTGLMIKRGFRVKNHQELTMMMFGLMFVGAFLLMTPDLAPVVKYLPMIHRFQFPWRLLSVTVISGAVVTAGVSKQIIRSQKGKLMTGVIFSAILIQSIPGWFVGGHSGASLSDEDYKKPVEMTTDTGESTPVWAVRFQDRWPEAPAQVVSGRAEIEMGERSYTTHRLIVNALEKTQIADNTLYFPGWNVYINGLTVPIEFQDENWRGVITFPVPQGRSEVLIKFESTRVRKLASGISIVFFAMLILLAKHKSIKA